MGRKLIYILVSILLLGSFKAITQQRNSGSVIGVLEERGTGLKVVGASVSLVLGTDAGTKQILASGENGLFQFNGLQEGRYILSITHISYHTFIDSNIIIVGQQGQGVRRTISMIPLSEKQMKEVIVRSETKKYLDIQLDKIVINVHSSSLNAGGNAVDVLNNAPGVMVNDNGSISLKGREGVIIYVDDKPLHLSGSDLVGYLRSLPNGMLDKIEIMANPPAKFNADGSAGIINIKTQKKVLTGFNGGFSLGYSQGKLPKSHNSLNIGFASGRWSYFANLGYSLSKNFYEVRRDRYYNFPGLEFILRQDNRETNRKGSFNYRFGADVDISKSTAIGIIFSGFASNYREKGLYKNNFSQRDDVLDSTILSKSVLSTNSENKAVNFNFRHSFRKYEQVIFATFDFYQYEDHRRQNLNSETFLPQNISKENSNYYSENPFAANISSYRIDFSRRIFGNIKLETGVQAIHSLRKNKGDYNFLTFNGFEPINALINSFKYKENINSAYLSTHKDLKRLSIKAGLRVEKTKGLANSYDVPDKTDTSFRIDYLNFFPTLFLSYKIDTSGRHLINMTAGRRISRPNYQDLNPSVFYFDNNTVSVGNSLLKPQFSTNLDLSYSYKRKLIIGLAYSQSKNVILPAYRQVGNTFISTSQNYERSRTYGMNLTWLMPISKWWSVNIYGEVYNSHFSGLVFEALLDRELTTFRHTGSSRFTLEKGWSVEVSGSYRTDMVSGQSVLGTLWQIHAGVQKKINDRTSFSFSGRDLFHSWVINRKIKIPYAEIVSSNKNDTRYFTISITHNFGRIKASKERRTGIQTEASRVGAN